MKKIIGIKEILKDFDGETKIVVSDRNNSNSVMPLTIKRVLLDHLGQYGIGERQRDGRKQILAWNLGKRIYECFDNEFILENEELQVLTECIRNYTRYGAVVMARVAMIVEGAIEYDINEKSKEEVETEKNKE